MSIPILTIPQYPSTHKPVGSVFVHHVILVKTPSKGMFNYAGAANISPANNLEKQVEILRGELFRKLNEEARKKNASVAALVDVKVDISVFGESSLLGQASATVLIKIPVQNTPVRPNNSARPNSPVRSNSPVRPNSPVAQYAPPPQYSAPPQYAQPARPNIPPARPNSPPARPNSPIDPIPQQGLQGQLGGRKKYRSKLGKSRKNRI